MRNKIAAYAELYHGDWSRIAKAIAEQKEVCPVFPKVNFITIVDKMYPECLKRLRFPPWILYYEGNLELLKRPTLGIVGSRDLCHYAAEVTKELIKNNKDKVIVSGLAKGADTLAHQCALSYGTIGVLGCGLDVAYPKENKTLIETMKKSHLVISEYPCGTAPLKHHFPWRNRLIAALSDHVVAVQAKIRSGTATTLMHAIDLSKPVYCVPYPVDDPNGEGCNAFIAQGAQILLSCKEKF